MPTIPFSVDSALLRELGERLVGKPHIALAELIKNSYDADATRVEVNFRPGEIDVVDNGHGMDFTEFTNFWMRIGTPHKQKQRVSRTLKRPVTGSKGVGRLAVQFLGKTLEIRTVAQNDPNSELIAKVNWDQAVTAGELTNATADYEEIKSVTQFAGRATQGTKIIISTLNQEWTQEEFRDLAREIWWLQPPFRSNPEVTRTDQKAFEVVLSSANEEEVQRFNEQMRAILEIWHARVVGKLVENRKTNRPASEGNETATLVLEFADGEQIKTDYPVPDCQLHTAEFEVRIFHLQHRQSYGIKVEDARSYLKLFGGVHVYDAGFNLPYYGPDTDWLRIEIDHSHRLSKSKLLPDELQVAQGLNFLPTQARLYGVVHVNTSRERELSDGQGDYLKIQVTRDRLAENKSLENLRHLVRWALDFYAMQEAKRVFEKLDANRDIEPITEKFGRVEDVLERHRAEISEPVYSTLRSQVKQAISASETQDELMTQRTGLLGALATAGISALAYEHEVKKQFQLLEDIAEGLKKMRVTDRLARNRLKVIADRLNEWIERARSTRALFAHLLDEENREKKERFKARSLIEQIRDQLRVLARGIKIEPKEIDESIRLPRGTLAEWTAIFQNIFLNATNAMLDSKTKEISVKSKNWGLNRSIIVQDTGVGVDLATAEELFRPFVRKLKISQERRSLGLGGTGLGLTIVKMIADNLGCKVAFIKPDSGFSTAFQVSWSEQK